MDKHFDFISNLEILSQLKEKQDEIKTLQLSLKAEESKANIKIRNSILNVVKNNLPNKIQLFFNYKPASGKFLEHTSETVLQTLTTSLIRNVFLLGQGVGCGLIHLNTKDMDCLKIAQSEELLVLLDDLNQYLPSNLEFSYRTLVGFDSWSKNPSWKVVELKLAIKKA